MVPTLTVSEVAAFLEVTERRVRLLLSQGRITGYKDPGNIWRITCPLNIQPGKRGPDFRNYASRKLQPAGLRVVWRGSVE